MSISNYGKNQSYTDVGNYSPSGSGVVQVQNDSIGGPYGLVENSPAAGVVTLKNLVAMSGVSLSETANTIQISATGSGGTLTGIQNDSMGNGIVEGSPVGSGVATLKGITSDSTITITPSTHTLALSATSGITRPWLGNTFRAIYVSPGGSNLNNGGPEDPLFSIDRAILMINGYADASPTKFYVIFLYPNNWLQNILLPCYTFISGIGPDVTYSGSIGVDTASWNTGSGQYGGLDNLALNNLNTFNITGTTGGKFYITNGFYSTSAQQTIIGKSGTMGIISGGYIYAAALNGGNYDISNCEFGSNLGMYDTATSSISVNVSNCLINGNIYETSLYSAATLELFSSFTNGNLVIMGTGATCYATIDSNPLVSNVINTSGNPIIILNQAVRSATNTSLATYPQFLNSGTSDVQLLGLAAGTGISISQNTANSTITNSAAFPTWTKFNVSYWVTEGGSDTNNGSPCDPFLTIAHAISVINANADASGSNMYNVIIGPGSYNDAILLPPFVFLTGLANGISTIYAGSIALDTTKWNAASSPIGGWGYTSLGVAATFDLSGTTFGELFIYNVPVIGAPCTFIGNSGSQLYIQDSQFFGCTFNGGTVKIYDCLLGSSPSSFNNTATSVINIRLDNVKFGANVTFDAHTHAGALTAYLGDLQFYTNSTLTINGSAAVVHASIDSYPTSGNLILLNGAADMILWNQAIRSNVAGSGISISTTNGISTITNTSMSSGGTVTSIANDSVSGNAQLIESSPITTTGTVKTLTAGTGITLTNGSNTVTITGTAGTITELKNDAGSGDGIVESSPVTSGIVTLKNLIAGSGVTLTPTSNNITIAASSSGGGTDINQIAFLDSTNGDNAIAVVGDITKPYQTFPAAYAGLIAAGFCNSFQQGIIFVQPATSSTVTSTMTLVPNSYLSVIGISPEVCIFNSFTDSSSGASYVNCFVENIGFLVSSTIYKAGCNITFTNCIFNGTSSNYIFGTGANQVVTIQKSYINTAGISLGPSNGSLYNIYENDFLTTGASNEYPITMSMTASGTISTFNINGNEFVAETSGSGTGHYVPINIASGNTLDNVHIRLNGNRYFCNNASYSSGFVYGYINGSPSNPSGYSALTCINESMYVDSNTNNPSGGTFTWINQDTATTNACYILVDNFQLELQDAQFNSAQYWGNTTPMVATVIQNSGFNDLTQRYNSLINSTTVYSYNISDGGYFYTNIASNNNNVTQLTGSAYIFGPVQNNNTAFFSYAGAVSCTFTGTVANYGSQQYRFYTGTSTTLTIAVTSPFVFSTACTLTRTVPINSNAIINIGGGVATLHIFQGL